jgi:hypothetical protein
LSYLAQHHHRLKQQRAGEAAAADDELELDQRSACGFDFDGRDVHALERAQHALRRRTVRAGDRVDELGARSAICATQLHAQRPAQRRAVRAEPDFRPRVATDRMNERRPCHRGRRAHPDELNERPALRRSCLRGGRNEQQKHSKNYAPHALTKSNARATQCSSPEVRDHHAAGSWR